MSGLFSLREVFPHTVGAFPRGQRVWDIRRDLGLVSAAKGIFLKLETDRDAERYKETMETLASLIRESPDESPVYDFAFDAWREGASNPRFPEDERRKVIAEVLLQSGGISMAPNKGFVLAT